LGRWFSGGSSYSCAFRSAASLRVRPEQLTRLDFHRLDCSLVGYPLVVLAGSRSAGRKRLFTSSALASPRPCFPYPAFAPADPRSQYSLTIPKSRVQQGKQRTERLLNGLLSSGRYPPGPRSVAYPGRLPSNIERHVFAETRLTAYGLTAAAPPLNCRATPAFCLGTRAVCPYRNDRPMTLCFRSAQHATATSLRPQSHEPSLSHPPLRRTPPPPRGPLAA
jgi:hypothetical protein